MDAGNYEAKGPALALSHPACGEDGENDHRQDPQAKQKASAEKHPAHGLVFLNSKPNSETHVDGSKKTTDAFEPSIDVGTNAERAQMCGIFFGQKNGHIGRRQVHGRQ